MNPSIKTEIAIGVILVLAIGLGAFTMYFCEKAARVPLASMKQGAGPMNGRAGMANPASVNCVGNGGELEIRVDSDGGQKGYCILSDGTQCEEWSYYRGECGPK